MVGTEFESSALIEIARHSIRAKVEIGINSQMYKGVFGFMSSSCVAGLGPWALGLGKHFG
jgi:hypothetical protein